MANTCNVLLVGFTTTVSDCYWFHVRCLYSYETFCLGHNKVDEIKLSVILLQLNYASVFSRTLESPSHHKKKDMYGCV
jgi:hypothetical protein